MARKRKDPPASSNLKSPPNASETNASSPTNSPSKSKKKKANSSQPPTFKEPDILAKSNENQSSDPFDIFNEPEMSVAKKRDDFISSKSLTMERKSVKKHLNEDFIAIEKRLKATHHKKVSDSPVQESSFLPLVIAGEDPPYSESMQNFCNHWILNNRLNEVISDPRSADIYSVPLKEVVYKFDRTYISNLSAQRVSGEKRDGDIHPFQYYVLFCASIAKQRNVSIRNLLIKFMERYFKPHSQDIMEKDIANRDKNMHSIIIYDKGSVLVPALKDEAMIICAVIFSIDPDHPFIYIDYVSTHINFCRGGFASMIINLAQHVALSKLRSQKVTDDSQVATFINCIPVLTDVYSKYGFKNMKLEDMCKLEHKYHSVFKHFDGQSWYESSKQDEDLKMAIMCTDKCIPRWTNYLSYDLDTVERKIFPKEKDQINNSRSNRANQMLSIATEEGINHYFEDYIKPFMKAVTYQNVTDESIKQFQSVKSIGEYISKVLSGYSGFFPVGKMFSDVYETYQDNDTLFPEKHSLLTKTMLDALLVRFCPSGEVFDVRSMRDYPVWVQLKCSKCKKACFIKKQPAQDLGGFLQQCIYSRWTTHVFGLSQSSQDPWNKSNEGWNVCSYRKRHYFHELKNAIIFDSTKPLSKPSQMESYNVQSQHVKILCNQFNKVYFELIDAHFGISIDIRQYLKSKRTCRSMTQDQRERSLMKAIGGTKSLVKPARAPKKQSVEDIKRRHVAEKNWNNEQFYNDLSIQRRFQQLVYVKPEEIDFDHMYPDSQDYVRYHRSEAYLNKKKKDPTVNEKLTHFVAITNKEKGFTRIKKVTKKTPRHSKDGNDHVICEDYFVAKTMYGKPTNIRRISEKTVKKCIDKPNKAFSLSGEDKRLIKAHVSKILAAGQIQKVRLMDKQDFKTESVLFEGKRFESRIRFQGIDSSNAVHFLSDDWLKINFEMYREFYSKIMNLKEPNGQYIDVPVGKLKYHGSKWPLLKRDQGPIIKYRQTKDNSCLFCSVASAFSFLGDERVAQKVMSVYDLLSNDSDFQPCVQNIIDILRNTYRDTGEMRLKVEVRKLTYPTITNLLDDKSHKIILVVLSNRHAVCLVKEYISDPTFEFCLPRTERCIKVCAEIMEYESTDTMIKKVYGFNDLKKRK